MADEYKVQLEVFEGPLDLLLYLIRKEELDIYDIPIERITTQYVQYIELMRMRDLAKHHGDAVRTKSIQYLGHALSRCAQKLAPGDFMLGHMGGGHFVCLIRPEQAQTYCERVVKTWRANAKTICDELGLSAAYENAPKGPTGEKEIPVLDLLGCAAARGPKDTSASQEIFEILSQIRKNAIAKDTPGIHYDRRAVGRGLFRSAS